MSKVIFKNSFKFEDVVEEFGEDKRNVVESILISLALNGYIKFDNQTKYYIPLGKKVSYFE